MSCFNEIYKLQPLAYSGDAKNGNMILRRQQGYFDISRLDTSDAWITKLGYILVHVVYGHCTSLTQHMTVLHELYSLHETHNEDLWALSLTRALDWRVSWGSFRKYI